MKKPKIDSQIIPEKLLREIYTRSSFLSERLDPTLFQPVPKCSTPEEAASKLDSDDLPFSETIPNIKLNTGKRFHKFVVTNSDLASGEFVLWSWV
mgnify:CR=1 FL=1